MPSINFIVLALCWGLFIVVWGLGWAYNLAKGPRSEGSSVDYLSILGLIAIFLLTRFVHIFTPNFAIPLPLWVEVAGGICLVIATGLTLWSRFVLGTMWSIRPQAKIGHQLRTDGPYRISRHPIYTGLIGMLIGSVLLSDANVFFIAATVIITIRLLTKIPQEEKLMIETFGDEYRQYQAQVPQLIPGTQWIKKAERPSSAEKK